MSRYYISIGHGETMHYPTIAGAMKNYKAQGISFSSSGHAPVNRDWDFDNMAWEATLADRILLEPDADIVNCAMCRNIKRCADEKGIPVLEMKGDESS